MRGKAISQHTTHARPRLAPTDLSAGAARHIRDVVGVCSGVAHDLEVHPLSDGKQPRIRCGVQLGTPFTVQSSISFTTSWNLSRRRGYGWTLIAGDSGISAPFTKSRDLMRVIGLDPVLHTTVRATGAPRFVARVGRVISVGVWQTRVSAMRLSSNERQRSHQLRGARATACPCAPV
jgi:hypothetical protein